LNERVKLFFSPKCFATHVFLFFLALNQFVNKSDLMARMAEEFTSQCQRGYGHYIY